MKQRRKEKIEKEEKQGVKGEKKKNEGEVRGDKNEDKRKTEAQRNLRPS